MKSKTARPALRASAPASGTWPGFVARTATHATPEFLADELVESWAVEEGGEIPGGVLAATLAQICVEIGTRRNEDHDGCWNGNVGNIRGTYALEGNAAAWTSFRAGEGFGAGEVILPPGPMNRFRSYLARAEDDPRAALRLGVRDFLSLLRRRYPEALARATVRDWHGYVDALHRKGYFTANAETYARAEDRLRLSLETIPQLAAFLEGAH